MSSPAKLTEVPTLDHLREHRDEILRIARGHGVDSVQVFGSVARGDAGASSDVDFLVGFDRPEPGFAYFGQLADLRQDLVDTLRRDVDVVDRLALDRFKERVEREAVAL